LFSKSGGRDFFLTRSGQPRGPHNLMYSGYWSSFSGLKHPGHGVESHLNIVQGLGTSRTITLLTSQKRNEVSGDTF
jgi:hypothetical protein